MLGGINAIIVGNYLTTLGRPAADDLAMLEDLADADHHLERHVLKPS